MSFKSFSITIICGIFLLFGVIWGVTWLMPLDTYFSHSGMWQQKQYIESHPNDRIIFLGDSRMKVGMDPAIFGSDASNIALWGTSTIEMYYTLKRYMENNTKPEAVVISLSSEHIRSIGSFNPQTLEAHTFDEYLDEINKVFVELDGKDMSREIMAHRYRLPGSYMKPVIAGIRNSRQEANHEAIEALNARKGFSPMGGQLLDDTKIPDDAKLEQFLPNPSNVYYLNKTLDLCTDNEIKVYYIQFPLRKIVVERMNKSGYMDQYKGFLQDLGARYPDAIIEYDIPVWDRQWFADDSHLNQAGAERFSAEVKAKYFD